MKFILMVLWFFCSLIRRFRKGYGISLIIPFQSDDPQRLANWAWLKRYWRSHLPGAEIIMGRDAVSVADPSIPFSKSCAVNDGARRATGDIFAIVDADGYVDADSVQHCANRIRSIRKCGHRLWFVPYRHFYRLTAEASAKLLQSSPRHPIVIPSPPPAGDIMDTGGSQFGHWYGAMIQILSREAFEIVGGWDERFRGWGGEDHAAMRATDTLYAPHKTVPEQVLHIWHMMLKVDSKAPWVGWNERVWKSQVHNGANDALSGRYYGAYRNVKRMRELVNEWKAKF